MALVSILHCSAFQEAAAHLRQTARSPSGARSRKHATWGDIVDAQLPPIAMRAAAGRAISAVQRHPALLVIHEHAT